MPIFLSLSGSLIIEFTNECQVIDEYQEDDIDLDPIDVLDTVNENIAENDILLHLNQLYPRSRCRHCTVARCFLGRTHCRDPRWCSTGGYINI